MVASVVYEQLFEGMGYGIETSGCSTLIGMSYQIESLL